MEADGPVRRGPFGSESRSVEAAVLIKLPAVAVSGLTFARSLIEGNVYNYFLRQSADTVYEGPAHDDAQVPFVKLRLEYSGQRRILTGDLLVISYWQAYWGVSFLPHN